MMKIKFFFFSLIAYLFIGITLPYKVLAQQSLGGPIEGVGGFAVAPADETEAGETLELILTAAVGTITILAGLFFLFYFIIGAMSWITSGGDNQNLEKARHKMTNAAIGLAIVIAAYSMTYIIGTILGLDILNPATEIAKLGPNP